MTPTMKIAASVALVSTAVLGLSACSSGSSSSASASVSAPAASASAPASSAASAAPSSAASAAPVNIADDVVAAYFKAVCIAPAAKLGADGAIDAAGTTCTLPSGKTVALALVKSNLGDPTARFSLLVNYSGTAGAKDVAGCPTIAEAKKATTAAPLTDECVSALLSAVTTSLSAK
ncbi:MAG: hypothetical protein RL205_1420 [Actinomycetota bacterium]